MTLQRHRCNPGFAPRCRTPERPHRPIPSRQGAHWLPDRWPQRRGRRVFAALQAFEACVRLSCARSRCQQKAGSVAARRLTPAAQKSAAHCSLDRVAFTEIHTGAASLPRSQVHSAIDLRETNSDAAMKPGMPNSGLRWDAVRSAWYQTRRPSTEPFTAHPARCPRLETNGTKKGGPEGPPSQNTLTALRIRSRCDTARCRRSRAS